MDKLKEIFLKKPPLFLILSLVYLVLIAILKWGMSPPIDTIYYAVGALLGVFFLDIAEVFFNLAPSPFRSIVFAMGFCLVSLFVVSSSDSLLGIGLVLSLYLTLLLWQLGEWQVRGNLTSWYAMVAGEVTVSMQQWILIGFIVLFLVETYLFVQ